MQKRFGTHFQSTDVTSCQKSAYLLTMVSNYSSLRHEVSTSFVVLIILIFLLVFNTFLTASISTDQNILAWAEGAGREGMREAFQVPLSCT